MPSKDNFNGAIDFVAPTGGVTAGTFKVIQGCAVLPLKTASAAASFPGLIAGRVKNAPKVAGTTWTAGQKLYWVTASSAFSPASTGNTDYGVRAAAAALSAATTGDVILTNGA
jgi:predicted RecA/RadA family phage recombinase